MKKIEIFERLLRSLETGKLDYDKDHDLLIDDSYGICDMLNDLEVNGLIDYDQINEIKDMMPTEIPHCERYCDFCWPLTEEGRQQRIAWVKKQIETLSVEAP